MIYLLKQFFSCYDLYSSFSYHHSKKDNEQDQYRLAISSQDDVFLALTYMEPYLIVKAPDCRQVLSRLENYKSSILIKNKEKQEKKMYGRYLRKQGYTWPQIAIKIGYSNGGVYNFVKSDSYATW